jgi:hypothetical protein
MLRVQILASGALERADGADASRDDEQFGRRNKGLLGSTRFQMSIYDLTSAAKLLRATIRDEIRHALGMGNVTAAEIVCMLEELRIDLISKIKEN